MNRYDWISSEIYRIRELLKRNDITLDYRMKLLYTLDELIKRATEIETKKAVEYHKKIEERLKRNGERAMEEFKARWLRMYKK